MLTPVDTSADSLPKVGEKLPPRSFGPFELADLQRYATASGDDNPIHLDVSLARKAGLEAAPVHGMLLMACFEPALQAWRADLVAQRLSGKFLRPVFVGDGVEISGRVVEVKALTPAQIILRLMAHNRRREIVILAEATLTST